MARLWADPSFHLRETWDTRPASLTWSLSAIGSGGTSLVSNVELTINPCSDHMWEKLGYKVVGVIPKVARLRGLEELVDAKQYYYDLTKYSEENM